MRSVQARVKTGDTAPLLRTIEGWLRAEKIGKRAAAAAAAAAEAADSTPRVGNALADPTSMTAGLGNGFAPGRFYDYSG